MDYFEKYYIGSFEYSIYNSPVYDIAFWSVFERVLVGLPITSNIKQAWQREVNERIGVSHPNIAHLIVIFKEQEEKPFLGFNQAFQGKIDIKQSKNYKREKYFLKLILSTKKRFEDNDACFEALDAVHG